MCNMCVMMTEIYTIEGGQKRCLLTRGPKKIYLDTVIILYVHPEVSIITKQGSTDGRAGNQQVLGSIPAWIQ